jgi:hypothetical protein
MTALGSLAMTADARARALGAILGASRQKPLRLLDCIPLNEGTFPGEVVRYRLGRGPIIAVFCKHGRGLENASHGHRGGPGYEAGVYEFLLRYTRCALPRFRGSYRDSDCWWLVMDYLDGGRRIHLTDDPEAAMAHAAAWAGHFHREQEIRRGSAGPRGLNRYDRSYYAGWARRARRFAKPLTGRFPWIEDLCERFAGMIDELLDAPQTLVHGEFYPKNILLHRGTIHPVDWESAAIGPGEVDLATLTEGWTRKVTRECESQYAAARWPDGAPDHFPRQLALCRLYVHLRWLGDKPEWTLRKSSLWHFKQLHKAGKQVGVLP